MSQCKCRVLWISMLQLCRRTYFIISFIPLLPFAPVGSCLPFSVSCSTNASSDNEVIQPHICEAFWLFKENLIVQVWASKCFCKVEKLVVFDSSNHCASKLLGHVCIFLDIVFHSCLFHNMLRFTHYISLNFLRGLFWYKI